MIRPLRTSLRLTVASALALGLAASAAAQDQVLYRTHFEATGDPSGTNFTPGNLNGQGQWTVPTGTANVVADATAHTGLQWVRQNGGSIVDLNVTSGGANQVIIEARHRGPGVAELGMPPADPEAAAIVAYRETTPGFYQVVPLDGNGTGGGEFLTEIEGNPIFSADQWVRVTILINYTPGNKSWALRVGNKTIAQDLGFRDANVSGFTGMRANTEVDNTGIDTVSVLRSDGDYDNDGVVDAEEMALDLEPVYRFGDVNRDGVVNIVDAMIHSRIQALSANAEQNDLTAEDVNSDSAVDQEDVDILRDYSLGVIDSLPPVQ